MTRRRAPHRLHHPLDESCGTRPEVKPQPAQPDAASGAEYHERSGLSVRAALAAVNFLPRDSY